VDIEAQDIAEQVVVVLGRCLSDHHHRPHSAERGVEIAVASELEPTALVIRQPIGLIDPDDERGARRIDAVGSDAET